MERRNSSFENLRHIYTQLLETRNVKEGRTGFLGLEKKNINLISYTKLDVVIHSDE